MVLPRYPHLSLSLFHPTPSPWSLPRILTSMGPDMPFQIKGVVEAFSTEGAQVSLHLAVALDVAVEHPLQAKAFATQLAAMQGSIVTGAGGELRGARGLREHGGEQQGTNRRNKAKQAGLTVALKEILGSIRNEKRKHSGDSCGVKPSRFPCNHVGDLTCTVWD